MHFLITRLAMLASLKVSEKYSRVCAWQAGYMLGFLALSGYYSCKAISLFPIIHEKTKDTRVKQTLIPVLDLDK